jgi:hypothetical protein
VIGARKSSLERGDPVYRLAVAWQNVSYNQPAHPGFYLGQDMAESATTDAGPSPSLQGR